MSSPRPVSPPAPFEGAVVAVLDARGRFTHGTEAAARLLGRSSAELTGTAARALVLPHPPGARPGPVPGGRWLRLRRRGGRPAEVWVRLLPLSGERGALLALGVPEEEMERWGAATALGRAVLGQDRWQTAVHDLDLRVRHASPAALRAGRIGPDGRDPLVDTPCLDGTGTAGELLRQVVDSGEPLVDTAGVLRARTPGENDRFVSLTAVRLDGLDGRPTGVFTSLVDVTERYRSRKRLDLVYRASRNLGASLDIEQTARDLVDLLVPGFADLASVEIVENMAQGAEPPPGAIGTEIRVRRTAAKSATGSWPADQRGIGASLPRLPTGPDFRRMENGEALITRSRAEHLALLGGGPEAASITPEDLHTAMGAVLLARGRLLGYVQVQRTHTPFVYDEEDAELLLEIVARAALSMDNARRYTREHNMAVLLQKSLLPPLATSSAAAETVGRYLPAGGGASVGGDWFDALPLSSLRTAFVLGDVIGHGLNAAATMARVRTAVQTLADLDLPPGELLVRLDDLVVRIAEEAEHADTVGASCLYAVYDPVTGHCRMASAGHPAPAVLRPDGTVQLVEVEPGPTLGVGGMPFAQTEVELPEGSVLVLYSDGFTDDGRGGRSAGEELCARIARAGRPGRPLQEIADALLAPVRAAPGREDDVTLLLARTRRVPGRDVASWQFPPEPAAVASAREAAVGRLTDWGLDSLAFSTELVVSELVTNAVRYAAGPVALRLIRDRVLICEVGDSSESQPRLRQARSTDEGGRGLFLVAQLTNRWGSRYGDAGKTIWTEQALGGTGETAAEGLWGDVGDLEGLEDEPGESAAGDPEEPRGSGGDARP
ncbi:SpoIIE family protein phosphatase [Streptomyces physcomitrii]|uniref:SpoIIE family protein phosphatase n=1 Tax=Streptomyces physcomitrii TaxID=2724184 RepID=UPI00344AEB95